RSLIPCATLLDFHLLSRFFFYPNGLTQNLHSFPTRRSSDLNVTSDAGRSHACQQTRTSVPSPTAESMLSRAPMASARSRMMLNRSEEHTSELQSRENLVCRLLLEKKKRKSQHRTATR